VGVREGGTHRLRLTKSSNQNTKQDLGETDQRENEKRESRPKKLNIVACRIDARPQKKEERREGSHREEEA